MPITLRLMSSLILFEPFHSVHLCPQALSQAIALLIWTSCRLHCK